MVPFLNGRREGANPSSRVIVLSSLESQTCFVDQLYYFKLGISIPSLKICIPGHRSHPYRKDRWRLHLYFCGPPSRAGNRYDSLATPLETSRVRPILCHMLSSIVIRMFNLSIVSFGVVIMYKFCGAHIVFTFHNMLSFTFRVMSRVGKGLCIPLHTLTCIFMT